MALLSLMGLYRYDPTFLARIQLPEGVDREIFEQNLLAEAAELEVLYSDPQTLGDVLAVWSARRLPVWEKLLATTKLEYNPIENYDRNEESTDNTEQRSLTNGSTTTVDSTRGFNDTKSTEAGRTVSETGGGVNTNTDVTRNSRVHGNIGVTTTQQMIEEERRVSSFDIYEVIINELIQRFCLLIY